MQRPCAPCLCIAHPPVQLAYALWGWRGHEEDKMWHGRSFASGNSRRCHRKYSALYNVEIHSCQNLSNVMHDRFRRDWSLRPRSSG